MQRRNFIKKSLLTLAFGYFTNNLLAFKPINTKNMNKTVIKKSDLKFTKDFPGLEGVNIMAQNYPIEPFLVFTEYRMDKPVFGPHPHAGISVMTYMLPDSKEAFINRDSEGDFSFIEPGGIHIMQAGSGMHHDEFPRVEGVETHGFQIWINHADKDRWVKPKSMHAKSSEVPEIKTNEYLVRIVHGDYSGKSTPYKMVTDVTLLHVFLEPNKSITLDAKEMAFVYVLKGLGKAENETVKAQTLINYSLIGETVEIKAEEAGLEFMFATGTPHDEPITYGGPFVMTTPEQMTEAKRKYAMGEMGKLAPYNG